MKKAIGKPRQATRATAPLPKKSTTSLVLRKGSGPSAQKGKKVT